MGWTKGENPRHVTRSDEAPVLFHEQTVPSQPATPAVDEPGYVDPQVTGLPLGTRYWQGFVKRSRPPPERAMSPELVASVTADRPGNEEVVWREKRETETERLSDRPSTFLPG